MYTASFCKLYEPVQLFCGQWKYLPIRPQESDVGSILLLPHTEHKSVSLTNNLS